MTIYRRELTDMSAQNTLAYLINIHRKVKHLKGGVSHEFPLPKVRVTSDIRIKGPLTDLKEPSQALFTLCKNSCSEPFFNTICEESEK